MISSLGTSSPVSASTFAYLIRWPVFLLIWLKWIFSESVVAGYRATGQVTRERRKNPFQLARAAMTGVLQNATANWRFNNKARVGFQRSKASLLSPDRLMAFVPGFCLSKPHGAPV